MFRVWVMRKSSLAGDDMCVAVTVWRWDVCVQLPRVRVWEAMIDDPDNPGDMTTRSEIRARRARNRVQKGAHSAEGGDCLRG